MGGVESGLCQGCGVRGLVTTSSDAGAEIVPALGFGVGGWCCLHAPHQSCVSTAHQVYRVDESRIRGMELCIIAVGDGVTCIWPAGASPSCLSPLGMQKGRGKEWGSSRLATRKEQHGEGEGMGG